jgi:hypothetical protein
MAFCFHESARSAYQRNERRERKQEQNNSVTQMMPVNARFAYQRNERRVVATVHHKAHIIVAFDAREHVLVL